MMMKLGKRGQTSVLSKIMMIPITLIILLIAIQLIDIFNQELFWVIDNIVASGSNTVLYGSLIKLLLGVIGLLIIALFVIKIIEDFSDNKNQGQFPR